MTNIISNNDKKIQEMEQEIMELKRQLKYMQRQNDDLNDRLFTLENLKSKDSSATFYSGFPNWETFMVVYTYLDPGEKGENISYWRSTNPGLFSDYTVDNKADESLTKKGRARSLRPQDEFLMVMCRLCLLYTSPSPRDLSTSRMPSSA